MKVFWSSHCCKLGDTFYDSPQRVFAVLNELKKYPDMYDITEVTSDKGHQPILNVHAADYIQFIREDPNKYDDDDDIKIKGYPHPKLFKTSFAFIDRHNSGMKVPQDIDGIAGYYTFDNTLQTGSIPFKSAYWSAQVAIAGAEALLNGDDQVYFSLCRPPGHHAGKDVGGGMCYLNNVAIATQYLLDNNCQNISVLDLDYHHGNGTQHLFYDQQDPLVVSIHGESAYPYYTGSEMEKGSITGHNKNLNIVLTDFSTCNSYLSALRKAIAQIEQANTKFLIVALGTTGMSDEPWGKFTLSPNDFGLIGNMVGDMLIDASLKVLVVMEGGYNLEFLGDCIQKFLEPLAVTMVL